MAELHQIFFMHAVCGHGSVLLLWHCHVLCIYFRFVDDVMFSHSGLYGASYVLLSGERSTTVSIPAKFS